ncbi:MAG: HAD-IA family hydrolase [Methanomicrobia archaeon]|nr:HAD-IA family hydrolase [Methanomicrobia archaeon]
MSQIRAVIFDCYGTLVDIKTDEGKDEIFHNLALYLQYYGGTIDAEKLKSAYELEKERLLRDSGERYPDIDLEQVFQNILSKEGMYCPFLAESCCKLQRLLSRERFQLFPSTLPVLREMKRDGYFLAVVSDAQKVYCWEEARILALNQFFDHMLVSTELGFKKPDPRLFAVICDLLNVHPAEAVYIGDNFDRDVPGPKQIGMSVILLDRDQNENKRKPGPDFYAKDLWEAWEWIKRNSKS